MIGSTPLPSKMPPEVALSATILSMYSLVLSLIKKTNFCRSWFFIEGVHNLSGWIYFWKTFGLMNLDVEKGKCAVDPWTEQFAASGSHRAGKWVPWGTQSICRGIGVLCPGAWYGPLRGTHTEKFKVISSFYIFHSR